MKPMHPSPASSPSPHSLHEPERLSTSLAQAVRETARLEERVKRLEQIVRTLITSAQRTRSTHRDLDGWGDL